MTPLNKPIRFLAIEWTEPSWEFDHPTVVLKPAIRYSPSGDSAEGMIEDLAIDMCPYAGEARWELSDEDVSHEFAWRGWSISNLKRVAAQCLRGKRFPVKNYRVTETWIKFHPDEDGDITFTEVKKS